MIYFFPNSLVAKLNKKEVMMTKTKAAHTGNAKRRFHTLLGLALSGAGVVWMAKQLGWVPAVAGGAAIFWPPMSIEISTSIILSSARICAAASSIGNSTRHGTHQVAQKLINNGLSAHFDKEIVPPSLANAISGRAVLPGFKSNCWLAIAGERPPNSESVPVKTAPLANKNNGRRPIRQRRALFRG